MIVIPMAGQSSRFFKAGYDKPKYQLLIEGKPLFDYCVNSFKNYFSDEAFLFVVSDENAYIFVSERCDILGVENYKVVVLQSESRGQAETVYLGLNNHLLNLSKDEPLFIFNIDTIRPNFIKPVVTSKCDGYLEVFRGEGDGWSFVELTENTDKVCRTTEKVRISDLCSTGLYYFKKVGDFIKLFERVSLCNPGELQGGEFYIAPMYNLLIQSGNDIRCDVIDSKEVIFCGVPSEYESILQNTSVLSGV